MEPEKLRPYFRALKGESDRGLIILLAAYIDDLLKELLTSFFVDSPKIVRELLESDGPLSSFSARARTAFCLGLINEDERADVDLIRRSRNEAAHLTTIVDFFDKSSPITKRCDSFSTLSDRTKETTPEARQRFMLVAAWLAVKISNVQESVIRREPPPVPENMSQLTSRALMLLTVTEALVSPESAQG